MKQIPLTKGLFATVDDDVFEQLNKFNWYAQKGKHTHYAGRSVGVTHHRNTVMMHRLIMNAPSDMQVDHIDGNGLNNQRSNLRVCTAAQNVRNSRKRSDNASGHKGVFWNTRHGKWQASIQVNGRGVYLGLFTDSEEAARSYDMAAKEYFGEFANLNFEQE